jgi:hypothetical protein
MSSKTAGKLREDGGGCYRGFTLFRLQAPSIGSQTAPSIRFELLYSLISVW